MQKLNFKKEYKNIRKKTGEIKHIKPDYAYNGESEIYEVPVNIYRRAKRLLRKTKNIILVNNYINKYAENSNKVMAAS